MLHDLDVPMPPHYERILQRSTDMQFPMNSDVLTGALLRALARMKPGGMFLELGTGCGLGTCWLLDGMNADSTLVSVDNSPAAQAIARDELGADARLTFVFEDGGEFLESCENGFDLIYADAWPGKYSHLDRALALLNRGGIYVIDDMLPQPNWPADHPPKVAALLQTLDALDDFEIAKLSWSTGIVLAVKC
jgi:predicted O-methyltransferase YrrM